MDPVTAVSAALGSIFDFFTASKAAKYGRLPDWLSPKDFRDRDNRSSVAIVGGVIVLVAIIVAIIISIRKKS
jgi:hypothetical protein